MKPTSGEESPVETDFVPILYLKEGCPHCLKVSLFLLEAGIADRFETRTFATGDEREQAIRAELAKEFDKVTFPAVQFAPQRYMNEADDIVALYALEHDVVMERLPLFRTFADKLLPRLRSLMQENRSLKARIEGRRSDE